MPTPANEKQFCKAIVEREVLEDDSFHCIKIEDNCGILPSRAILVQTFGQDVDGPVSLTPPSESGNPQYGDRIKITLQRTGSVETTTAFRGYLMKRSDQMVSDRVIWQALDDKILLQWLPVRGCLVWDAIAEKLRYSPRHPTLMNPGGFWNCTGYEHEGTVYPVFTNVAHRTRAYEAPTTVYGPDTLIEGKYCPWTPRRALLYLRLWATIGQLAPADAGYPLGLIDGTQSFLASKTYVTSGAAGSLYWERDTIDAMVGYDPADGEPTPANRDPLDYKLDSLNLQGMTQLTAIDRALDVAGTHKLQIGYDTSGTGGGASYVNFAMTGYAPTTGIGGKSIMVQRGGSAGQIGAANVADFSFDEDASETAESVLVEGDVIRGETRWEFYAGEAADAPDYSEDTASMIIPAWTKAEERSFLECFYGQVPAAASAKYAKRAKILNATDTLEVCDGGGTPARPVIYARSKEALDAARESFPTVYRAWKINGRTAAAQSFLGRPEQTDLDDESTNPGGISGARPMLPEQLQFMVRNLGGGEGVENWLLAHLPIRVQLATPNISTGWYTVPKDVAVRVTPDGLIWLDGLAEQEGGGGGVGPSAYCVIIGDIHNEEDYDKGLIRLKSMRINAAVPTDYRVRGQIDDPSWDSLNVTFRYGFVRRAGVSPGLLRYVDAGGSFKHHYQKDSYPSASGQYYGGTNGTTAYPTTVDDPLTRDVPPGDEAIHAEYMARRKHAQHQRPTRTASFVLMGIDETWRGGSRISYVELWKPTGSRFYYLNGPMFSVTHDFLEQTTSIGGIIGQYQAGK